MNSDFKAAWVKQILLDLLLFGSYAIWKIDIIILEIFSKRGRSKIKMWALFVHCINQNLLIQGRLRSLGAEFGCLMILALWFRTQWMLMSLLFSQTLSYFWQIHICDKIFINPFITLMNVWWRSCRIYNTPGLIFKPVEGFILFRVFSQIWSFQPPHEMKTHSNTSFTERIHALPKVKW